MRKGHRPRYRARIQVVGRCDAAINNTNVIQQVQPIADGTPCVVKVRVFERVSRKRRPHRKRNSPIPGAMVTLSREGYESRCAGDLEPDLSSGSTSLRGVVQVPFSWMNGVCGWHVRVTHPTEPGIFFYRSLVTDNYAGRSQSFVGASWRENAFGCKDGACCFNFFGGSCV
ncbi:hypothetical protein MRY87_06375 [bacterium]|nr:hypothetical protein [bacterium]